MNSSSIRLGKIPEGGAHIDMRRKTVSAWQTADTMGFFQALPELWPGWQTEVWEDRFEEHVKRCDGALRVPELNVVAGVESAEAWIRKRVFEGFEDSPAGHIAKLAGLLAPVAPGFEVSSDALSDCGVRPTNAEWSRFVRACDLLRSADAESA
jgi:hypothetical protein